MILDASVAAKWFIPGEDLLDEARAIREAMLDRSISFAAPAILWSEIANAVVRAVRRKRIDYARAVSIASELVDVEPLIESIDLDGHATIHTALTTGLTAYDAQYVALASARRTAVLTADHRMFEQCEEHGVEAVWLGDVTLRDGVLVDTPQGYP